MLGWILYDLLVSLFLTIAALAAEQAARRIGRPTRGLWGLAIVATLSLPLVISTISISVPALPQTAPSVAAARPLPLKQLTRPELSPLMWLPAPILRDWAVSARVDHRLRVIWLLLSAGFALTLVVGGWSIRHRQRHWRPDQMAGQSVLVSADCGPAIVGLLRPKIVVPAWIFDCSPAQQRFVIAHECAHLQANDARLLTIALCLILAMPWNLPLWWQFRRLRQAIEVDCDQRVLAQGFDRHGYGETLLTVAERQSGHLAIVAAMSESSSTLNTRMTLMFSQQHRNARLIALLFGGLSLFSAIAAAEVGPPDASPTASTANAQATVAVSDADLDRLVGQYQMTPTAILVIRRDNHQLSAQLTGQPSFLLVASNTHRFTANDFGVELDFVVNAEGTASSVTLHQHGQTIPMARIDDAKAKQIAEQTGTHFANQTANPASEPALRHYIEGLMTGTPDYESLSPLLAEATRKQLPKLAPWFQQLGPITKITFIGVTGEGNDTFSVFHDHGVAHWQINVGSDGKIAAAWVTTGP